jgi:hypothetical protein
VTVDEKNSDCKQGATLDFIISSFIRFFIDMPEDGSNTGQNMYHICKDTEST